MRLKVRVCVYACKGQRKRVRVCVRAVNEHEKSHNELFICVFYFILSNGMSLEFYMENNE